MNEGDLTNLLQTLDEKYQGNADSSIRSLLDDLERELKKLLDL